MFRVFCAVLIAAVVVLLGAVILIIGVRSYKAINGRIHGSNGIDEEGYIDLCGQEQYYLIRGEDVSNPVIIWIHGGPASPDTMETYTFSNYLKDDYTVVAWNQRGCGRTYYKNKEKDPNNDTAIFEQAQADLDALVDVICDRFQQKKVILVGHSYGTMVGSKYAIEHPDKVAAYVGVGQMGASGSDVYAYEDALSVAQKNGDDTTDMVAAFETYQADATIENMLALRKYVSSYHTPEKEKNYLLDALTSPYLGIYDVLWFTKQLGNLSDFVKLNRQLFDYISTEDYFNAITAPKKEMQLIDGWGHNVPLENPKEFAETLMQVLDEILNEIMQ